MLSRKILRLLSAILIVLCSFSFAFAKEKVTTVEDNVVINDRSFKMDFSVEDMTYYPFIFSDRNKWEVEYVIGPSECENGYLYSKDLSTNTIRKLVNVQVDKMEETENCIYFIYDNTVYSIDYLGKNLHIIFKGSRSLSKKILCYYKSMLYILDDNNLIGIDVENGSSSIVLGNVEMDKMYVKNDKEIVFSKGEVHHIYNIISGQIGTAYNDFDASIFYIDSIEIEDDSSTTGLLTLTNEQLDTNLIAVFNEYPSGSYFSQDGLPCEHHLYNNNNCSYWGYCNCKNYSGCIQCVAHAKYSSDNYAHKTNDWNAVSGDIIETDIQFTSTSQVRVFFNSCVTGAYIRLSHESEASQEQNGFHSMFYVNKTSTSVKTYECNRNSNCNVEIINRTFESFENYYSDEWGIYRVSHKFHYGNCVSYSSQYHKRYCNSSGCGGYIYEAHYATNNMGTSTCEACGYVGVIEYTSRLELGKYQ